MKIIKVLSEKIKDELADAKSYANMALEYKDEWPELSRTLYNLSTQEMASAWEMTVSLAPRRVIW